MFSPPLRQKEQPHPRACSRLSHVPAGPLSPAPQERRRSHQNPSSAHQPQDPALSSLTQTWTGETISLARLSSSTRDAHSTHRTTTKPHGWVTPGDAAGHGGHGVPAATAPPAARRAGASRRLLLSLPLCVCSVRQKQYQFAAQ